MEIVKLDGIMLASASQTRLSYYDAVMYCRFLNVGGFNDWRLPTYKELCLIYKYKWLSGLEWGLMPHFLSNTFTTHDDKIVLCKSLDDGTRYEHDCNMVLGVAPVRTINE